MECYMIVCSKSKTSMFGQMFSTT